ncbi:aminotransferase class I/II-fold pyridoxal phosphate-dependent enzyme [Pseudomonas sp. RIT-PI-S]|uniref:pyridoxal phosphate-dependent aminotransferase n=1 Tax=Pseudomonas sp. RIT-PI-S TaxID=3035295 RepID=UPI0021DA10CD|nr:aminotransferase class I/II-fold pyridoxal phosphate-dependent enzyme [Pseudomonas sp. RIT-PI-S]
MTHPTPRPARQLRQLEHGNPFPGIAALERSTGTAITARLSANEAMPLYSEALTERYGQPLLEHARRYPDPCAFELRQAIAARHGLNVEDILVDAGADALIFLFLRAFSDPGSVVLASAGTYPTAGYFARSLGLRLRPVNYSLEGGIPRADLAALAAQARVYRARVVYLANPDNPTGSEHSAQAVAAFARSLPAGTLLILDEAYEAFGGHHCAQPLPNVVRLRSFSKGFGLAGLRVGYAIAPPSLLAVANQARVHYSVGTVAQQLAREALEDTAHQRLMIAANQALRGRFAELAQAAGVPFFACATNFMTLALSSPQAGETLRDRLLAQGACIYLGLLNEHLVIARVSLQPELFTPQVSGVLFRSQESN